MKRTIATLCATLLVAPVAVAAAPAVLAETTAPPTVSAAAATTTSRLVALPPDRALDTRIGLGGTGPLAPGASLDLPLAGTHGVPADATAVVLNLTIVEATGAGYVQAYPAGQALQGKSSNLNVETAKQTIPNLAIVPLGANGAVTLYAQAGGHLVADVLGAFVPADTATAGRYEALDPARLLDTRNGTGAPAGKVAAGASIDLQVTGKGGVPTTGVSAVALNVTAVDATTGGYVQAVPKGGATALGASSNLNVVAGQVIANLVIVPVGADGKVTLYSSGGTHLLADVTGWFTDSSADDSTVGLFTPVSPDRLLDTRTSGVKPAAGSNTALHPGGNANVPSAGVAAVALNVTATQATAPGFVQAYPAGTLLQGTSSTLNVERAGQTIPNAAISTLGVGGTIALYTQSGTHLLADVSGWFSAQASLDPGTDPDGGTDNPPPPPDPTGPLAAYTLAQPIPGLSARLLYSTENRTPTAAQTVTVRNIGQQTLQIGVSLIGTHATSFAFVPGTPGVIDVPPGASADVGVIFAPPAGSNFKVHSAQLQMTTNDPAHERILVTLKGLNALGFEGPNEPTLDELTDAIGFPGIDTGSPVLEFADKGDALYGDENLVDGDPTTPGVQRVNTFRRADPSQPVGVLPIASYTANHPDEATFGIKANTAAGGTGSRQLGTFRGDLAFPNYKENQKLMPVSGGVTSFVPSGGPTWPGNLFGFVVNSVNDQQAHTPTCTAFRVYPARITETNTIPNTYVVATDINCVNGDFNDYVFLVSNVVPRNNP